MDCDELCSRPVGAHKQQSFGSGRDKELLVIVFAEPQPPYLSQLSDSAETVYWSLIPYVSRCSLLISQSPEQARSEGPNVRQQHVINRLNIFISLHRHPPPLFLLHFVSFPQFLRAVQISSLNLNKTISGSLCKQHTPLKDPVSKLPSVSVFLCLRFSRLFNLHKNAMTSKRKKVLSNIVWSHIFLRLIAKAPFWKLLAVNKFCNFSSWTSPVSCMTIQNVLLVTAGNIDLLLHRSFFFLSSLLPPSSPSAISEPKRSVNLELFVASTNKVVSCCCSFFLRQLHFSVRLNSKTGLILRLRRSRNETSIHVFLL